MSTVSVIFLQIYVKLIRYANGQIKAQSVTP
jgi:hypothetical protein